MERFGPLLVVFFAILLNIIGAVLLKTMASRPDLSLWLLIGGVVLVAAVNILRFLVWGLAHKKYPLSKTYPLSSLFFPMILIVSYFYGEEIRSGQILGGAIVTIGVFWIAWIREVESDVEAGSAEKQ
ncbi:Small Multidrug Resistance (SMR) protein [Geothermobacter ehrlichii]|uniref:Small Multidrug Resistance (SMR) protein n=1 Tax=Geothermobacter ehrlichii TaxID=213224 RepID=A0A5D3WKU7_9BACT|nr:hypothetical protein [Geothermobacter ehrlichii]TYO99022.1 Small Multidrug Resistance (SMR) protein [Geothermobacter ehrlichii]